MKRRLVLFAFGIAWGSVLGAAVADTRIGALATDGGEIRGELLTAPAGNGLAWRPEDGGEPVPLGPSARIRYRGVDTRDAPQQPAADGTSGVFLRCGDAFFGRVVSADGDGVTVQLADARTVTIPTSRLRVIVFRQTGGRPIFKHKKSRLLTLPRMQQSDPPTHVLRTTTGDYLRGRLVGLDGSTLRFEVLSQTKAFPLDQIASLIWLGKAGEPRLDPTAGLAGRPGTIIQVVGNDGNRLTVAASQVEENGIVGQHAELGAVRVPLAACAEILAGNAIADHAPAELPYDSWVLTPAPLPKALAE